MKEVTAQPTRPPAGGRTFPVANGAAPAWPATRGLVPFLASLALLLASAVPAPVLAETRVPADFSEDYGHVYQIRVVSSVAGGKSSIGSGFQVSAEGHLLTNYHVVSDFVDDPDRYRITYVTADGRGGDLELLDFDVVGDLAVLRHPVPGAEHFSFAPRTPEKGAMAYALGNPGDWGIVMVPGPINGLVEHRYERRLLFSGSLNPGMSGGPSLDVDGRVVGVNVATAGSQLSFLVPVETARTLLAGDRTLKPDEYAAEIAGQLKRWQGERLGQLIDMPWPREDFNARPLFGEIRKDFQCWGDSNEEELERSITRIGRSCRAGDSVYVNGDLQVGQIRYAFVDTRPERLNAFQFANSQNVFMSADNRSSFRHSTEYRCQSDFVRGAEAASGRYDRLITCIRAYKNLPGLFDSLHMVLSVDDESVRRSTLSVSGAERTQILALNRRFTEEVL